MKKNIQLQVLPHQAADEMLLRTLIAEESSVATADITGFTIDKKSIDARGKTVKINLALQAFINEPFRQRDLHRFAFQDVSKPQKKVVIIGAGPAGLFAAIQLIECGIKPVILERGKDVRERRRDLAALNKKGKIQKKIGSLNIVLQK